MSTARFHGAHGTVPGALWLPACCVQPHRRFAQEEGSRQNMGKDAGSPRGLHRGVGGG